MVGYKTLNFRSKRHTQTESKEMEKDILSVNGNDKKLRSSNSKEKREDPMNKVRNEEET